MDYDVSISIGTTANLGGVDKATKAVEDMGKAIDKLPPQLLPGGVGGTGGSSTGAGGSTTPTYTGTPSTSGGMTWRLDGMTELTGAVTGLDGSLDRMDKSITITSQRLDKNSGWLSRSINALASLPGKLQSWGGNTMQSFGKFNGGLQNLTNMVNLGKQAWDLGWSIGESLNEAFGVKVKQIDSKVAAAIQAAQDKLARWQDNLEAARAQHREDAFLKQEAAGVKAVNDAYAARLRTIEAIDRKAMAGLEHQQRMLQIENEKNRHIIQERKIRGEITDSQARDMLAMIDAKDANERMEIERKQAEQAVATSQAKADAAEERYRKLQELSRSGMARQAVQDLNPMQVLNQADALKQAEEDLARWKSIIKRQKDALKEVQQATKDQARAATMLPLVGAPIALARKQDEDQARQDYDAAIAAQHEFMRAKGMNFNVTDKGNEDILKKAVEERRKALDNMLGRIGKTGLIGNLDGKNDDERLAEYVRVLQLVQSVIKEGSTRLEEIFLETEAAKQQANEAKERLQTLLNEQQSQKTANEAMAQETAKTNAKQDDKQHTATLVSGMVDRLAKAAESQRKTAERQTKAEEDAKTRLGYAVESLNRYAAKYENTPLSGGIERILQTITKLQGKPVKDRTKEENKDLEQLRKWIEAVKDDGRFDNLVKAATAALNNMDAALAAEKKRKEAEAKAKTLEERSRKLADLAGQMDRNSKDVLTLDDWMTKQRSRITDRMGELERTDVSGHLPAVEALVRKTLSDEGDGGKGISQREAADLAMMLRQLEAISPRDSTPELEAAMSLIRDMLGGYKTTSDNQRRMIGEIKKMQAEVALIKSQAQYGPRR